MAAVLPLLCAVTSPAAAFPHSCWNCDLPFGWDDEEAPPLPETPFPQGFVLTGPIAAGASGPVGSHVLDRYAEVARALGQCLSGDPSIRNAPWSDLTLRVSFKSDGTINGVPRVVHVSAADQSDVTRGRDLILSILPHCTPLSFSPSLGRAIAGQIFAIRFVQQRNH